MLKENRILYKCLMLIYANFTVGLFVQLVCIHPKQPTVQTVASNVTMCVDLVKCLNIFILHSLVALICAAKTKFRWLLRSCSCDVGTLAAWMEVCLQVVVGYCGVAG